jgi:glycosyltransferase involved in cell wall biosynthesis
VLATCNGERFLEQQLESLLQQTLSPDLILIFDDASDDATPQLLEKYASLPTVKVSRNIKRIGANENFKQAVGAVTDGYDIAFCDQDDYWLPEKLERSVELLHSICASPDQPAMIYSDLILMDEDDQILSASVHQQRGQHRYQHVWDTFLFGNMVSGCTIVMNSAMKPIMAALPETNEFVYDAWLAMAAFGWGKIACLPEPMIHYRQHSGNQTFAEHRSLNRSARWLRHLKNFFGPNQFLREELALAQHFQEQFASKLSPDRTASLQRFIRLEKRAYLIKKIAFEQSFNRYWTNRFS